MKPKENKLVSLLLTAALGLTLTVPTLAQAGGGHHRHGHHHHDHGHHHHHRHSHQPHMGGYNIIYNQPRAYYNQAYYPQPSYNYYPPVPVYAYPPSVMLGIDTGDASFMLRY
ncbi:MAG TPA: hypothetical protein PKY67_06455 [Nitrosomonas sp.]|nr:hypothetical protein [Nitrosomonas sp.]HRB97336.1 hypothetical protein [Nitrosomonas sp.]